MKGGGRRTRGTPGSLSLSTLRTRIRSCMGFERSPVYCSGVSSERMRTRSSPPYILMSLKIFSKMSHRNKTISFIK